MRTIHVKSSAGFCEKNTGFTLIELLVAVAVSSIVLLAVGQFFISTNKANTIQEKVAETQQGIRAAMEMMARDIRMAGLNPEGSAEDAGFANDSSNDDETDVNSISIRYDYDGDGSCEVDVCYHHDSDDEELVLRRGGATEPLTELATITSLNFEYTLSNDTTTSNPSDDELSKIKKVDITICGTITGAYSEDLKNDLCFTKSVKTRNL
ncbi:MAG: PilW family protein [Desulfosalsimonas sp.]